MPLRVLRHSLSQGHAYVRRLATWVRVAREISGLSKNDRQTLRRAIVRSPIDALKNLRDWRDPQVDKDCRVQTSIGRFQVRAACDDLYLVLPSREPLVLQTIRDLLRPGDCFVDAGANIGVYTILAAQLVRPAGTVIAVEMMPETAGILRQHIVDNDVTNVEVVEHALSDVAGQILMASVEAGKSGSASIAVQRHGREIRVQTTTLAHVIAGMPAVRLIKMDLEGAELAAVQGLSAALDRVEYILFEDWGDNLVAKWLSANGFNVTRLDANNSLARSRSTRES